MYGYARERQNGRLCDAMLVTGGRCMSCSGANITRVSVHMPQVIRSVEQELGQQGTRRKSDLVLTDSGRDSGNGLSGERRELVAKGGASCSDAVAFGHVSSIRKERRVRWSMHEQFEEDLKADLAEAQRRDLPSGAGSSSAFVNPKLEAGVNEAVNSLLEILGSSSLLAHGAMELRDKGHGKRLESKKGDGKSRSPRKGKSPRGLAAPGSTDAHEAVTGALDTEGSDTLLNPAPARPRPLRKGDSGNLRKMLLERRKTSSGRSSQELLTMLHLLDGDEDNDDAPDELVLCRLCEQQVLRSSLQLHTAVCKATHKAKADDEAVNREVRELLDLLSSTRRQALLSLVTIAVQRHMLLCAPLDKLVDLGGQLLRNDDQELSPLHHLGRLTELARELAQLKRSGGAEVGGSVFFSCASQMKAVLAEKIAHVQALIDLDPHALDASHSRPLKRGSSGISGKLGIKDFTLIRRLASGGFAQVWLAKKKSTGDVMAIKSMRKEHLRNTDQARPSSHGVDADAQRSPPFNPLIWKDWCSAYAGGVDQC